MKKRITSIIGFSLIIITVITGFLIYNPSDEFEWLNKYNIVWETQSKNSSESMPLGGGDIGCNVWVENGELLFYLQRSGSLSENGEYLKLGRVRIKFAPNPFENSSLFRQELILKDGYIEIEGSDSREKASLKAKIKLWVDVNSPVMHVDINTDKPVEVIAAYESWRTEDKELRPIEFGRERFGCFSLEGYPGKVIKIKDNIEITEKGILFYHRNPKNKLIPEVLIKQQGLEGSKDLITDDIKNRTFGGLLYGKDFVEAGIDSGKYIFTSYKV